MSLLEQTCSSIAALDWAAAARAQELLDQKTKPRRSLGRLEDLACRLAAIYRAPVPALPAKAIVVMAGDHGVAAEVVSAFPQEVTVQMLMNFAAGGAAINVLARQANARVVVVDMGTKVAVGDTPGNRAERLGPEDPVDRVGNPASIREERLGPGTANFVREPAMSRETAERAVEIGIRIARELSADGIGLIGVGDMGIANTTSASALTALMTGVAPAPVVGRGTGIDNGRLRHKIQVVESALNLHRPSIRDSLDALSRVGGFEIAGLAGVMLGAAAGRVPVVLDGFITAAAGLAAVRLCPAVRDYLIAAHQSVEPGHQVILRDLEMQPLFNLNMRLGEGTGAVLAMNFLEASLRILREMATFKSAGVSGAW